MRVIQGITKDTPVEAMPHLLHLLPMETRQTIEQVKAYSSVIQNPKNVSI